MDKRETRETRSVRTPGARDENKLPVWARQELQRLRANVDYYQKRAAEITGETPTKLCVNKPGLLAEHEPPCYLDPGLGVVFTLGEHDITVKLDTIEGGREVVQVYTSDGRVGVLPACSNVLYLYILER